MKIVKIGGNVIDNEQMLDAFCRDFAALEGPKVLIHGGGAMAGRVCESLGIPVTKIEGRRVTDAKTLDVVTMVYAGLCNKKICALLQKYGCNAIGLSGCDGSVITAKKRPPIEAGGSMVDFGFVGDVTPASVNASLINKLLEDGLVPVFSAINHNGEGVLLNTNADTMASSIAAALKGELIICFEKNGVLMDKDDDNSVIPSVTADSFEKLKDQHIIADGMLPKLANAFKALRNGATKVTIKNSAALLDECGTTITLQ